MLTINDTKHIFNLDHYSYACKSTDEKPTHAVENSWLLELDTNTLYYYAGKDSGWTPLGTAPTPPVPPVPPPDPMDKQIEDAIFDLTIDPVSHMPVIEDYQAFETKYNLGEFLCFRFIDAETGIIAYIYPIYEIGDVLWLIGPSETKLTYSFTSHEFIID